MLATDKSKINKVNVRLVTATNTLAYSSTVTKEKKRPKKVLQNWSLDAEVGLGDDVGDVGVVGLPDVVTEGVVVVAPAVFRLGRRRVGVWQAVGTQHLDLEREPGDKIVCFVSKKIFFYKTKRTSISQF